MHMETIMEWIQRYPWTPWLSEVRDTLWGSDEATLQIHMEAPIKRVWRFGHPGRYCANLDTLIKHVWWCTWRLQSCNVQDHNSGSLEMHLDPLIEWVWTYTWMPWLSKFGLLGGGESDGGCLGGRRNRSWDSICWLTHYSGNVKNWAQHDLLRDERLAGSGRQLIMGWYSMQFMPYSGYAVLCV